MENTKESMTKVLRTKLRDGKPVTVEQPVDDTNDAYWVEQPVNVAAGILKAAASHMEDRASTYDQPQGERSMAKTVEMFNTLTEHGLTEEQGWLFMSCLKMVRAQAGKYRADSYEDGAAYFALAGESAAKERV